MYKKIRKIFLIIWMVFIGLSLLINFEVYKNFYFLEFVKDLKPFFTYLNKHFYYLIFLLNIWFFWELWFKKRYWYPIKEAWKSHKIASSYLKNKNKFSEEEQKEIEIKLGMRFEKSEVIIFLAIWITLSTIFIYLCV